MLDDHEQQSLAQIERSLRSSDPRLVAGFRSLERNRPGRTRSGHRSHTGRSMHTAGGGPCLMLALGLLVLLVGAAAGAITIVVAGVVLTLLTLGVAATHTARPGPGFA